MSLPRIRPACAVVLLAVVAACGDGEDPPTSVGKYVGQWASSCDDSGLVADAHPERELKAIDHLTLTWAGDQQLAFHTVRRLYVAADCSGMPVATLDNHGAHNRFAWHAGKAIGGAAVDEFDVTMDALGGPRANGPQVVAGVRYPGDFFIASIAGEKDVLSVAADGLRFGTGDGVDADGYPVALDGGRVLRKQ
jgi:hypothetical protein